MDEARMFMARALRLDPDLRLSNLEERAGPLQPDDFNKYRDALRLAGLPE